MLGIKKMTKLLKSFGELFRNLIKRQRAIFYHLLPHAQGQVF